MKRDWRSSSIRDVTVLAVDAATSFQYARIFADPRKRGTPIPQNDFWIAALAFQHDLPLDHETDILSICLIFA